MSAARQRKNKRDRPSGLTTTSKLTSSSGKTQTKSSSCLSKLLSCTIFALVLVGSLALIGYFNAPLTALPTTDYSKEVKLAGKFEVNRRISKGIKVSLDAPESIEEDENGFLYTGLENGKIVRIAPSSDGVVGMGDIHTIADGLLLKKRLNMRKGRPLGIRLFQNSLYVADAYLGLYSIDLNSEEVTSLIDPDNVSPRLGFVDDLCFSKNKKLIYFTDASSKYSLATTPSMMLEGLCDGRVLQYNTETKEIRTMVSSLCLANGIQLSNDGKRLFVSEFLKYRVRIIDTISWETKQIVHLPMTPDNIRPTGKGTFWIAGGSPWTSLTKFTEKYYFLRQIVAGLFSDEFVFKNFPFNHNFVVEMNEDGEILQTLHDPEAKLTTGLSQVTTLKDGRMVLGSFMADRLAFSESKIEAIGNL